MADIFSFVTWILMWRYLAPCPAAAQLMAIETLPNPFWGEELKSAQCKLIIVYQWKAIELCTNPDCREQITWSSAFYKTTIQQLENKSHLFTDCMHLCGSLHPVVLVLLSHYLPSWPSAQTCPSKADVFCPVCFSLKLFLQITQINMLTDESLLINPDCRICGHAKMLIYKPKRGALHN